MTISNLEPTTYYEAALHQGWNIAMLDEKNSIYKNETWTIKNLLPSKSTIST